MAIINGVLAGLGKSGGDIANVMVQSESRRQQEEDRRLQREQDLAYQRQTQLLLQDSKNEGRLDATAMKGTGKSSGGGGGMEDIVKGSLAEEGYAASMNQTVPQFRAMRDGNKTGDYNKLADEMGIQGPTMDGRAPIAEKFLEDKRKVFAEIAAEAGLGKDYKDVTEGRATQQGVGIVGKMVNGQATPTDTAEAMAARKGEGAFGKGNVNQFTGKADEVGKSVITENNAQAGQANASAGKARAEGADVPLKGAREERQSLADMTKSLDGDLNAARGELKDLNTRLTKSYTKADKEAVNALIVEAQAKMSNIEAQREDVRKRQSSLSERAGGRSGGGDSPKPAAPSNNPRAPAGARPPLSSFNKN